MPVETAVFIPGIMGSCLQSSSGRPLWDECFLDNYRRLAFEPAVLQYDGIAANAPRVLSYIRFVPYLPIWRNLYHRLLSLLKNHPHFRHDTGVVEFPYDWRENLEISAAKLGQALNRALSVSLDKPSDVQLTLVTHSMGGLVARVALVDRRIHPKNIKRIIHVAPPLFGSASAFGSLFGDTDLPLLDKFVSFCHDRKNGVLALKNLQHVMTRFPSIYQLMPPVSQKFIYTTGTTAISPLDKDALIIPSDYKRAAGSIHRKLLSSTKFVTRWKIPLTTICGNNATLKTAERYKVFIESREYQIIDPCPLSESPGDGTVTKRSCSYDGIEDAHLREVVGETHALMCNSKHVVDVVESVL
jgi:pimeloyl-ACP methyl ester carboxylesterase